jgi:hypothetical protein
MDSQINGTPPADIDLERIDVRHSKPVKGTKRRKPPVSEALKSLAAEARIRADKRPASPGIVVEPHGKDGVRYESPHRDWEAWELSLADAFGTRSPSAIYTFLNHLCELAPSQWSEKGQRWKPSELELNFSLNFINGIRPKNEAEAALAAQMVAVHFMTMRVAGHNLSHRGWIDPKDAAVAGKLARTFTMQCEAMAKMKGKSSRQRITVRKFAQHEHRHIHLHQGDLENGGQPHGPRQERRSHPETVVEYERCAALPGPDEEGDPLPVSGPHGPEKVPDTRGRGRRRGADG